MAESEAIARPYARAVFDLARESGDVAAWSGILAVAAQVVAEPAMKRAINAPGFDPARLIDLVTDVARRVAGDAAPLAGERSPLVNFLRTLADNGRLAALPAIASRFDKLKAELENRVEVVLKAPAPVSGEQQERLAEALRRRLGRDVSLTFELDESLIGGARLVADDLVIDGSVRTGLEKLSRTLMH